MRENRRLIKINEEIRRELNQLIGFKLKNPKINGIISVSKVNTTNDLRYATVYVSMMNKSPREKKEILEALRQSKGFLRSEIARLINLRITPEFLFKEDDTLEHAEHLDEIFRKIRLEQKEREKEEKEEIEEEDIEEDNE